MQVNIVDPLKLAEEFGNILANPVIASHVEAMFIVHKGLYVLLSLFLFLVQYGIQTVSLLHWLFESGSCPGDPSTYLLMDFASHSIVAVMQNRSISPWG